MEQAEYWMWTKRKHSMSSHFRSQNPYDDSWEEQAFAEDAAGSVGGCVWPPRSYSCSFCRREFRSAQALGGHMNVHRRDRARLKQSSSSPKDELDHDQYQNNRNHPQNTLASLSFQYPSQLCTLVYNPNPNSDPAVIPSPSSTSRFSALPAQKNCPEKTFLHPLSSPIVKDQHTRSTISSPQSWSNLVADKYYNPSNLKNEGKENSKFLEPACTVKADYVKTDLSVSLNSVVRRTRPTLPDDKEEAIGCKRRRKEASSVPFSLKPYAINEKHHLQLEELELSPIPIPMEELDLELRLGDRPKVK